MQSEPYTSDAVETALYRAGFTLMALPSHGCWPATYRSNMPECLRDAEDLLHAETHYRVPVPPPAAISAMDQALSWVRLLPGDTELQIRVRKLVSARLLVSPRSERPLYSWRRLGEMVGCSDHTAKTRWIDAVEDITSRLNRPGLCGASGGLVKPAPDRVQWTRRPTRINYAAMAELAA